jgi:hypothetical protein
MPPDEEDPLHTVPPLETDARAGVWDASDQGEVLASGTEVLVRILSVERREDLLKKEHRPASSVRPGLLAWRVVDERWRKTVDVPVRSQRDLERM